MRLHRWIPLGFLFLVAGVSLCGCALSASAPKSNQRPPAGTPPQARSHAASDASRTLGLTRTHSGLPTGAWVAVGRVVTAHGYLHRRAGEVLARRWSFTTTCHQDIGCRTRFSRITDVGPSTTLLVPHHGYLTADFPPVSVPCLGAGDRGMAPGTPGRMYSSYKLWWSANRTRLIGAERSVSHDRCVPAASRTRWRAISTARAASSG